MNKAKTVALFCFFLISFYSVLALKFQYLIIEPKEGDRALVVMGFVALIAIYFLTLVILNFNPLKTKVRAAIEAFGITVAALFTIGFTEASLSNQQYLQNRSPSKFSTVTGHCGVYSGRTILKLIHAEAYDVAEGQLKEFKINQSCRLGHLGYLMQDKSSVCEAKEDGVDCLIRWMSGISEHGYWSRYTRKFFFDQVLKWWPQSKNEEALVNYVAKDQELESGRQSVLKQAGIEEAFNSRLLLIQEREELSNLMLTRDIFKTVELSLNDVKTNQPPYLFKFKDLKSEVEVKLAKIPELEKEVEKLKEGKIK